MKRFKTISEFNKLITDCRFCGGQLKTYFLCRKIKSNEKYILFSTDTTDNLINFYYELTTDWYKHLIFSVDINTNKVIGDVDKVQKVLWDNELAIKRACPNESCDMQGYFCETEKLYLERKTNTILPFKIELECINAIIENKRYILSNDFNDDSTVLISYNEGIVSRLPHINLHEISGKNNIINKIKTILVFL